MEKQDEFLPGIIVFALWKRKMLLILRDDKPEIKSPNMWCPITGGVEEGETYFVGAQRELNEELGISPAHLKLVGINQRGTCYFLCRLTNKERAKIKLGEGQKYDFFTLVQILDLNTVSTLLVKTHTGLFEKVMLGTADLKGEDLGLATFK